MRADGLVLALALAIGAASAPVAAADAPPALEGISPSLAAAGAQSAAQAAAWTAYLAPVLEAMRTSTNVREQALALAVLHRMRQDTAAPHTATAAQTSPDALGALARSNPDDLLVQRIAAMEAQGAARAAALARLQQLEPDNAANWALSLPGSTDETTDPLPTLTRMAASARFDEGTAAAAAVWSQVFARFPPPPDVLASASEPDAPGSPAGLANMSGFAMAMTMPGGIAWQDLLAACKPAATDAAGRRERCVVGGRLLLHEATTLLAAHVGEGVLRRLDAIDDRDAARITELGTWRKAAMSADGEWNEAFLADWLLTGSEIEALRLGAARSDAGTTSG